MSQLRITCLLLCGLAVASLPGWATKPSASDAYKLMGIKPAQVLSGTALNAKVVPGSQKQFVVVVSYMTGKKDQAKAINSRLEVFQLAGGNLNSIYSRDFGAEQGGYVADADLQLVDLDRDGVQEIITSFRDFSSPLIEQRVAEVLLYGEAGFSTAWRGPFEYDATRAARDIPVERRDRFKREVNLGATMRVRGEQLHLQKRVIAIAGERLAEPKTVEEVFPLRAASR